MKFLDKIWTTIGIVGATGGAMAGEKGTENPVTLNEPTANVVHQKAGTSSRESLKKMLDDKGVTLNNSKFDQALSPDLDVKIDYPEKLTNPGPAKEMRRMEVGGLGFADPGHEPIPPLDLPDSGPEKPDFKSIKHAIPDPNLETNIELLAEGYEVGGMSKYEAYSKAQAEYGIANAHEFVKDLIAKEKGEKTSGTSTDLASK